MTQDNNTWKAARRELKALAALTGREANDWHNSTSLDCGRVSFHIEKPDALNCHQSGAICATDENDGQAVELLCSCEEVLNMARHYLAGIIPAGTIYRALYEGAI